MKIFKDLLGQTAVYGLSSIVPRLLNFLLVPIYTRVLGHEEYGIVAVLFAYIGIALVSLTYGTETGYFRYVKDGNSQKSLFSTLFIILSFTSILFLLTGLSFSDFLTDFMEVGNRSELIIMLLGIIFFDVMSSIPFARLRYFNKAFLFFSIKMFNVGINVGLNLFFLLVLPYFNEKGIDLFDSIYKADYGVAYILLSNVIASGLSFIVLLFTIEFSLKSFDFSLLKKVLAYSFPLLIAGLSGNLNEVVDRILIQSLVTTGDGLAQTGIYSANIKIAVLMTLFIQAFKYAADPFFFKFSRDGNAKDIYAETTKYFIAFCMFIYLGIMCFLDIVIYFIDSSFQDIRVVPIMLLSNMLLGILFNLAVWYKINNLTKFGVVIGLFGVAITLIFNIIFIPVYGYMASTWTHLACNLGMVMLSYLLMKKYYPINYDLKRILLFVAIGLLFSYIHRMIDFNTMFIKYITAFVIMLVYLVLFLKIEKLDKKLKTYIHARSKNC